MVQEVGLYVLLADSLNQVHSGVCSWE